MVNVGKWELVIYRLEFSDEPFLYISGNGIGRGFPTNQQIARAAQLPDISPPPNVPPASADRIAYTSSSDSSGSLFCLARPYQCIARAHPRPFSSLAG